MRAAFDGGPPSAEGRLQSISLHSFDVAVVPALRARDGPDRLRVAARGLGDDRSGPPAVGRLWRDAYRAGRVAAVGTAGQPVDDDVRDRVLPPNGIY